MFVACGHHQHLWDALVEAFSPGPTAAGVVGVHFGLAEGRVLAAGRHDAGAQHAHGVGPLDCLGKVTG